MLSYLGGRFSKDRRKAVHHSTHFIHWQTDSLIHSNTDKLILSDAANALNDLSDDIFTGTVAPVAEVASSLGARSSVCSISGQINGLTDLLIEIHKYIKYMLIVN